MNFDENHNIDTSTWIESYNQTLDYVESEIKKQTKELVEEIKAISSSKKTETAISTNESTINEDIVGLNTFYIHFIPNPEILQNGTNPLYLIDELNALGNSYVIADTKGIPESSEINLENCYVILDEAQNCTLAQIKMFITRMGQGSKVLINGDTKQCDLSRSGLWDCIEKLEGVDGVGISTLTRQDIQRNGILGRILTAMEN